ncbi:hypothetical protein PT2222_340042 [Paraburkholderia tropica]
MDRALQHGDGLVRLAAQIEVAAQSRFVKEGRPARLRRIDPRLRGPRVLAEQAQRARPRVNEARMARRERKSFFRPREHVLVALHADQRMADVEQRGGIERRARMGGEGRDESMFGVGVHGGFILTVYEKELRDGPRRRTSDTS